jgi:hypothetical protein
MPSRTLTAAVVLFWLMMMAWLVRRDVWPRLVAHDPPRFTRGLADGKKTRNDFTRWTVRHSSGSEDAEPLDYVFLTNIRYDPETDLYRFACFMKPRSQARPDLALFHLKKLETTYLVDTDNRMAGLEAKVEFLPGLLNLQGGQTGKCVGAVTDDYFVLAWEKSNARVQQDGELAVQVSRTGTVHLPLHPLETMKGLHPGQTWRVRMLDPLECASAPESEPSLVWLNAEVRGRPEPLEFRGQTRECLVIDYRSDDESRTGSTWVAVDDLCPVLLMTFRMGDDFWKIRRDRP